MRNTHKEIIIFKRLITVVLLSLIATFTLTFSSVNAFANEIISHDSASSDEAYKTYNDDENYDDYDDYEDYNPSTRDEIFRYSSSGDEATTDQCFTGANVVSEDTSANFENGTVLANLSDYSGSGSDGEDVTGLYLLGGVMSASAIIFVALRKPEYINS